MKRKGRIQVGMDADVVVFDLANMQVLSTYTEPTQHSVGMRYVLVNGTPVITDGRLDTKAFPGTPVRRPAR